MRRLFTWINIWTFSFNYLFPRCYHGFILTDIVFTLSSSLEEAVRSLLICIDGCVWPANVFLSGPPTADERWKHLTQHPEETRRRENTFVFKHFWRDRFWLQNCENTIWSSPECKIKLNDIIAPKKCQNTWEALWWLVAVWCTQPSLLCFFKKNNLYSSWRGTWMVRQCCHRITVTPVSNNMLTAAEPWCSVYV